MMSDQASIDRIPNRSSMLVFAPPAAIKHSFSASDSFDARLRYSAKRFPFFGLEPTGCAGIWHIWHENGLAHGRRVRRRRGGGRPRGRAGGHGQREAERLLGGPLERVAHPHPVGGQARIGREVGGRVGVTYTASGCVEHEVGDQRVATQRHRRALDGREVLVAEPSLRPRRAERRMVQRQRRTGPGSRAHRRTGQADVKHGFPHAANVAGERAIQRQADPRDRGVGAGDLKVLDELKGLGGRRCTAKVTICRWGPGHRDRKRAGRRRLDVDDATVDPSAIPRARGHTSVPTSEGDRETWRRQRLGSSLLPLRASCHERQPGQTDRHEHDGLFHGSHSLIRNPRAGVRRSSRAPWSSSRLRRALGACPRIRP